MGKEIILYNLADNVTDEQYKEFVTKEKGPTLESLPSVKKKGAKTGEVPFNYVGILHVESLDEFYAKGAPSQKFQDLMAKMMPMFKNIHILYGEEVY
jgi:hypothetical protein